MRIALLGPCLVLAACAAPNPEPPTSPSELARSPAESGQAPRATEPQTAPVPWEAAHTAVSTTGRWIVRWTSEPSPIPENEPFTLAVWVLDAEGAPADVELSVDAAMPQHGHGMNRVPRVVPNASRGFDADGLLFHMPGSWQLYFDVTRGALTERAQVEVVLE